MRTVLLAGACAAGIASVVITTPPRGLVRAATTPHRESARAHRRPSDQCTGIGDSGFVGGGAGNAAAGPNSGVVEGADNESCASEAVIGGGTSNIANGPAAFIGAGAFNIAGKESFVGSGVNNAASLESFVGSGVLNAASASGFFVGAGDSLYGNGSSQSPGNVASGVDSFVGAGDENLASGQGSFIGAGGSSWALTGVSPPGNQVSGVDSFIGAGDLNDVLANGSFIGAGGYLNATSSPTGLSNSIGGADSFIGAGDKNNIGANDAFLGGGRSNNIPAAGTYAAIAGGDGNTASGADASVAGGAHNSATGTEAAVGGGSSSSATGHFATIPGGYLNAANGIGSFAAGTQAKARHNGAFVWSDNAGPAPVQSMAANQFVARASGGYYLFTNAAASSGVRLNAGSGAWSNLSDRTMKTGVTALDDAAVLAKVAALPVSEWSYTSERGVRHVGPMAQDFYAAFGVGEDDRHITSIDEDGVALAAIKALAAENRALRERVARDAARFARDESQRARDSARLFALERKVEALAAR